VFPVWSLQAYHDFLHDVITASIELERCRAIFGRPLEIDDVQRRPKLLRPVHAPQPRVPTQNFEARAETQDHVGLLGGL